ncbi:4'-phosphopantetheinyl transferase superfamily protein [Pontibacter sp. G13]|uniref:4'-phosphopantetheinyl transferase family protein n=1 Tax=Pontibacter sp. G13 TaxID=3074898 RepID=UPI0028892080|nr:4'-phosphopantetheinyl transferase superfamily protein [Pontibacter sp. G13]WNJ20785.1 4'-phosphopantetheinyl transferase superfamily protein [Pontibacter sp. G13]
MPFIPFESTIPNTSLGLWNIEEDELFFLERVKLYENEWTRLADIVHPQKRLEWLSSRLCLKELLKIANTSRVESLNTHSGKPYLTNNTNQISYSHSGGFSAAIASPNLEVGIDIEDLHRKRNIRTRFLFMNDEELAFYDQTESFELFLLIWSAKETLYKIVGEGHAFKHNLGMDLAGFQLEGNGILPAFVQKDDLFQRYEIHYLIRPDFVLTYAATCV